MERTEIYSVAISSNMKWVAASSEKGTLHVFHLRPDILSSPKDIDHASSLSLMRGKTDHQECSFEEYYILF